MAYSFVQGKITELDCDVIINPCDEKLSGCIGIDLQVHRAGGRWLSLCCRELGPIWPGQAVISEGGSLRAKYVVHTAVPWYIGKPDQLDELRACYRNSLLLCERQRLRRIALPLMGLGFRAFPEDFVMQTAMEAVEAFLQRNPEAEILLLQYDSSWDEEDEEAIMNG